jgi:hypothetical protein
VLAVGGVLAHLTTQAYSRLFHRDR